MKTLYFLILILTFSCAVKQEEAQNNTLKFEKIEHPGKQRNIIFILTDDHRFDFMGFTGKVPWLKTPNMDRMAAEGAYFPNTFVTTSLCSPSRASILTGLYSHTHTIVDNQAPMPDGLTFFPQYLQAAGYETAFFGKWHMGDQGDNPQPGFDHWESFNGQGVYYNPTLNINGERITYGDSTYITDLLTQHVIDWIKNRDPNKPFFIYLSHKAVHADFQPAARHAGDYANEEIIYPPSYNESKQPVKGKRPGNPLLSNEYYGKGRLPDWVKMQRESWHGVDYMYHGAMDFEEFFKSYCETLEGIDESVGSILDYLDEADLAPSTMVAYMGDNGFSFGEHGLIDKRQFYEESVKVPFLVRCPEILKGGIVNDKMIQNIDLAPTFMEIAGIKKPDYMPGMSFIPILKKDSVEWRDRIFYEYYWEYDFPQTPTMHGVRTNRYKYIRYHGIWDTNELYDLKEDPYEMNNIIADPKYYELEKQLAGEIYDWLESTGGMKIPLKRTVKTRFGDHRNKGMY